MDSESNEIIESFKLLQNSTREYLDSLKENKENVSNSNNFGILLNCEEEIFFFFVLKFLLKKRNCF